MTEDSESGTSRRRFLETAATVSVLGVAGCSESGFGDIDATDSSNPSAPRWQFELTGWAGSPAVDDGTLFVTEVFGGEEGAIYAVSTEDGTEQWRFTTGDTLSDPVVQDDSVYVGDSDHVYSLSTADGSKVWQRELPDATSISGLTVTDDAVYVGSINSHVYSLSRSDGSVNWRTWQQGTVFEQPAVSDGTVYAAGEQEPGAVYAFDAADGAEQWGVEVDREIMAAPTVVDGTVYVAGVALSATDGGEVWRSPVGKPLEGPGRKVKTKPVVVDGLVLLGSNDNFLYALDASDGSQRWTFETGFDVSSTPTVVDGIAYFGSGDEALYALSASDGTEQGRVTPGGEIYSSPTVVDDTVYVGTSGHTVYAIPLDQLSG